LRILALPLFLDPLAWPGWVRAESLNRATLISGKMNAQIKEFLA
jgi:hypothetical protein